MLISINWPSLVTSWFVVQNIYSKMHLVSCTNTHCDTTYLVNHGMVRNTKTWMSWEWNIFLQTKKNLNQCFRWHILRSYCLVAEVTFKWGTVFFFLFFFGFYFLLPPILIYRTKGNYVFRCLAYKNQVCIAQAVCKSLIGISNILQGWMMVFIVCLLNGNLSRF